MLTLLNWRPACWQRIAVGYTLITFVKFRCIRVSLTGCWRLSHWSGSTRTWSSASRGLAAPKCWRLFTGSTWWSTARFQSLLVNHCFSRVVVKSWHFCLWWCDYFFLKPFFFYSPLTLRISLHRRFLSVTHLRKIRHLKRFWNTQYELFRFLLRV